MINDKLATSRPTELGVRFTPLEIHSQAFDRTFRGYDEDQVNEYLDLIIKDYETYNIIIQQLQAQIAECCMKTLPKRLSLTWTILCSGFGSLKSILSEGQRTSGESTRKFRSKAAHTRNMKSLLIVISPSNSAGMLQ